MNDPYTGPVQDAAATAAQHDAMLAFVGKCAHDLELVRQRVTVLTMALQRVGENDAANVLMRDVDDALCDYVHAAQALIDDGDDDATGEVQAS